MVSRPPNRPIKAFPVCPLTLGLPNPASLLKGTACERSRASETGLKPLPNTMASFGRSDEARRNTPAVVFGLTLPLTLGGFFQDDSAAVYVFIESMTVELSNEEISRYSRHLILPEVGMSGQKKLKATKVLCVGTGGLGSPI